MRILQIPELSEMQGHSNGIARCVENYCKYLPAYGIEFVSKKDSYDLKMTHAGITGSDSDIAILHGMYFTGDYPDMGMWAYKVNKNIVDAIRHSRVVTVPSNWVAEIFQRDMHYNPFVVPHGIDYKNWDNKEDNLGYILWNKNRDHDVCTTEHVEKLAARCPNYNFVSTFGSKTNNMQVIGVQSHPDMKKLVQQAGVYLATTKETFGIGTLEAIASGVPVLGFSYGGTKDIVKHKETGYLANFGDYEDLENGLNYILKHRKELSRNCLQDIKNWSWEVAIDKLYRAIIFATTKPEDTVSIVIPLYNKASFVETTITSAFNQTHKPKEIVVVDDGSTDSSAEIANRFHSTDNIKYIYIYQNNQGVAHARNNGIELTTSEYICCLDSDDSIEPDYIERCMEAFEDKSVWISYTGLRLFLPNGTVSSGQWPQQWDFDKQINGGNQVPTCCVFKKELWRRLGGYRQRYAPMGAGSEDAEFWLRAGLYGYSAKKITDERLFNYSVGVGTTALDSYKESNWRAWHSCTRTGVFPFASYNTPGNGFSNKVYQYDEPEISIVIPVGTGHEDKIINALDSIESQSFIKWEVVVVWDSKNKIPDGLRKAYPFVRFYNTEYPASGAGTARNIGVKNSRGKLILFLDADDWFYPDTLEKMYNVSKAYDHEIIIYSDYVGKAIVAKENLREVKLRLLEYKEDKEEAVFYHEAMDYNCSMAQQQPDERLYHWCLISCLIPKKYHESISGFDENMVSWEDVDYHWRMCRKGYCYFRITEPLIVYNFHTGTRREKASGNMKIARELLDYMSKKYKGIEKMGCRSCSQKGTNYPRERPPEDSYQGKILMNQSNIVDDNEYVKVLYRSENIGDHAVIGNATKIKYGYRQGGDIFLIHKKDYEVASNLYELIEEHRVDALSFASSVNDSVDNIQQNEEVSQLKVVEKEEVEEPEMIIEKKQHENGLDKLSLSKEIISRLREGGIETLEDILLEGVDGLVQVKGIGLGKAQKIYDSAKRISK